MAQQSNTTADGTLDTGETTTETTDPTEKTSVDQETSTDEQPGTTENVTTEEHHSTDNSQTETNWGTGLQLVALIVLLGTLAGLRELYQTNQLPLPPAVQTTLTPLFRELTPILTTATAITVVLCGLYLISAMANQTDQ